MANPSQQQPLGIPGLAANLSSQADGDRDPAEWLDRAIPQNSSVVIEFSTRAKKQNFVDRLFHIRNPVENRKSYPVAEIGYVSHGTTLLSQLTVFENLLLQSRYHYGKEPKLTSQLSYLCREARFDTSLLGNCIGELDAVKRIKATFLQAILPRPEIILFDSVFETLDGEERQEIALMIASFHRLYPLRKSAYIGLTAPEDRLFPSARTIHC